METVNSIAAAASKVIWGEPQETTDAANATIVPETKGTEPISGELGDTKKGEPYDLGNSDSTTTQHTVPSTSEDANPTTTLSPPGLAAKPLDTSNTSPTPDSVSRTLAETHIAPLSSETPSTTSFKPTSEKPLISEHINPNLPSTPGDSTLSTQSPDIKSFESSDHGAATETTKNTDGKGIDITGPGPKPLEELARKNGGAAGKPSSTANAQGVPTDLQPLGGEKHGVEGTGEKYVKSSGLQAEGGNFDATNPGAGREADRLLGKEGKVEKSEGVATTTTAGAGAVGGSEVTSSEDGHGEGKKEGKLTHLKEKIKEKLHKH